MSGYVRRRTRLPCSECFFRFLQIMEQARQGHGNFDAPDQCDRWRKRARSNICSSHCEWVKSDFCRWISIGWNVRTDDLLDKY